MNASPAPTVSNTSTGSPGRSTGPAGPPAAVRAAVDVEVVRRHPGRVQAQHGQGGRCGRRDEPVQPYPRTARMVAQQPAEPVVGDPGEQRDLDAEPAQPDGDVQRGAT